MNRRMWNRAIAIFGVALMGAACGGGDDEPLEITEDVILIPEFYETNDDGEPSEAAPELTVVADSDWSVNKPNDLAFHPDQDEHPFELWVINEDIVDTGGSTVTLFDAGSEDQSETFIRDGNAWHFMSMPTSISFSQNGNWASGIGVQDANHQDGTFAGPTLWSSDFDTYGAVGDPPTQEFNGSHLDMLHGSPYAMGVAYEHDPDSDTDNAFWIFDGFNGYLVRYDFQEPHYPGGHNHSDGLVHRYADVEIARHESLPSHMIVDQETGWLYVNDTGNNRVLRMDTASGELQIERGPMNEPLEEHWMMENSDWEVFAEDGIDDPTGIALNGGRLFVSNHGTEEIIAFDIESGDELARIDVGPGIRGITVGPDHRLWLADYDNDQVLRVDPQ